MKKTVTEHTYYVCTLCGGRGQEVNNYGQSSACMTTCRQCQGSGQVLTTTVTRTEEFDVEELAKALADNLRANR